jgi:hypothetical protein
MDTVDILKKSNKYPEDSITKDRDPFPALGELKKYK